ncbi:hypothetical protein [Burkholderia contaminans]|uniref:Uncharacterized protein n=1 Tax=Burkholderia contaminans TaxID=488447 RepID=A0A6P2XE28_9BURK|nr:hypothetical protein [Burkholderia contaminans]VWD07862.1 hypothetical protein BCO71171_02284 [Burkholderia contaminans]
MAVPLLMGEWAVLMETIRLRLERIKRIDPDSLDEDALTRVLAYIESNFARTFGGLLARDR